MPPVCFHMVVAKEAAQALGDSLLEAHLGSYLLGATAPDIRIITGNSREELHFFDLAADGQGAGVKLFFRTYRHLAKGAPLDEATRAFVSGYLSHLVVDEIWIIDIYRPVFGPASLLGRNPAAAMMDRALQYELDRRERLNASNMADIRSKLKQVDSGESPGFIDKTALKRWREFIIETTRREPSWERFRSYAENFLLPQQKVTHEALETFLASPDAMLQRIFQAVSQEDLKRFREKAVESSVGAAREYRN
ncbi:MAG: zinc dependent phospholipase C family protein [Chloroflexota bacterium]|nr:zinc dependent phospholipase C family protein [Chloroflexota bacterium]